MLPRIKYEKYEKKTNSEIVKTILEDINNNYIGERSTSNLWVEIKAKLIDISNYCTLISYSICDKNEEMLITYYNEIDKIIYVNRAMNEHTNKYWAKIENLDPSENKYPVPVSGYEIWGRDEDDNLICHKYCVHRRDEDNNFIYHKYSV